MRLHNWKEFRPTKAQEYLKRYIDDTKCNSPFFLCCFIHPLNDTVTVRGEDFYVFYFRGGCVRKYRNLSFTIDLRALCKAHSHTCVAGPQELHASTGINKRCP